MTILVDISAVFFSASALLDAMWGEIEVRKSHKRLVCCGGLLREYVKVCGLDSLIFERFIKVGFVYDAAVRATRRYQ